MKHYFQFLFLGAVLLGSLILFNHQKSEPFSRLADNPDPVRIELLAEICTNQIASTVPSIKYKPELAGESWKGNLKQFEYLNSAAHKVRNKTQMKIHLELLPVLVIQSGQNLHKGPGSDDPPLS